VQSRRRAVTRKPAASILVVALGHCGFKQGTLGALLRYATGQAIRYIFSAYAEKYTASIPSPGKEQEGLMYALLLRTRLDRRAVCVLYFIQDADIQKQAIFSVCPERRHKRGTRKFV
jgi:hypothetical protein